MFRRKKYEDIPEILETELPQALGKSYRRLERTMDVDPDRHYWQHGLCVDWSRAALPLAKKALRGTDVTVSTVV
ncbi:MAG TPA: hypothetical protein VF572_02495 [Candidatus Saccharimonadales bacterium]|jgi:hypothetical protein